MHRVLIIPPRKVNFRYLDSVQAALVEGLVHAGVPGDVLVGHTAHPWTFACFGWTRRGGLRTLSGILVSSASDRISAALGKLDPARIRKTSSNGDVISLDGACVRPDTHVPVANTRELCVVFPGRFALTRPKTTRSATEFARSTTYTDFSAALKAGLDRRAKRTLDLDVAIDPLTLATEDRAVPVALRKTGDRRILIPAFNMPVTLRGNPDDLSWAFHAGLGAKTRQGFGCPTPAR